jgi:hypothetical protein
LFVKKPLNWTLLSFTHSDIVGFILMTTILEPNEAPVNELAALHQERWEIETALDQLKTHLMGAHIVLRSKTPELVRQEAYGLILAHFAIRGLMHEAALKRDLDADQLSFLHSVTVVKRKLQRFVAAPPEDLPLLHQAAFDEVLEVREVSSRGWRNQCGVKRKMSSYHLQRKGQGPQQPNPARPRVLF